MGESVEGELGEEEFEGGGELSGLVCSRVVGEIGEEEELRGGKEEVECKSKRFGRE